MSRKKQSEKTLKQMREFFKENPAIGEALRVFEISYDQYRKALEPRCDFYTHISTSPPRVSFRSRSHE